MILDYGTHGYNPFFGLPYSDSLKINFILEFNNSSNNNNNNIVHRLVRIKHSGAVLQVQFSA